MPGPRSCEVICSPTRPSSTSEVSVNVPPRACLTRLVASSLTASVTAELSCSTKPTAAATAVAACRATATSLIWETCMIRCVGCCTTLSPLRRHLAALLEPAPFAHRDPRAPADLGGNFKLIHEPLGSWQTQTQPTTCSIPFLHRLLDIGNARAVVL